MINSGRYIGYIVALLTAALITGCAGASAPPVELPAPVTGQIDISGPSAAGKVSITGTAGAVTGGAIVLAINETTATSSLWQVTDFLFPKAYAQTLPSVCDLVGRVCVVAEADGSFTMEIDAEVGDSIIIVLIDENGTEISDRITKTVPTGSGIVACGSGFEGSLVAIANSGGVVYALHEGSTDSANKILIGSEEFQIPGCYAKDIAVFEESSGAILIAVASSSDNKLWIGKWSNTNLIMGLTYTLDIAPYKVAFAGDSTEVIVAGIGTSVQLELISVADGSTTHSFITLNTEQNAVVALDTVGPFADGGYLGMIVGSDVAGYYLTFFHASTFANVTSNFGEIVLDATTLILSDNPEIPDASFSIDPQSGNAIRFLFTDRHPNFPAFRFTSIGTVGTQITLNDNAESFASLIVHSTNSIIQATNKLPQHFVVAPPGTAPTAYILTGDGYLWRIINYFSVPSTNPFDLSSILPNPIAIAMDETGTSLTGGNAAGTTTDLSSYIAP